MPTETFTIDIDDDLYQQIADKVGVAGVPEYIEKALVAYFCGENNPETTTEFVQKPSDPRFFKALEAVKTATLGSKSAQIQQKQLDTGKDLNYWIRFVDSMDGMEAQEAAEAFKRETGKTKLPKGLYGNRQKLAQWCLENAK